MYHKLNIMVLLIIATNNINQNSACENVHLHQSLTLVIKHIFIEDDSRLSFFVNYNSSLKKELFKANDFVNGLLYDINNATYEVFYQHKKSFRNLKNNEVIILDNLESFRYFFEEIYKVGNMNLSRTLMFISSITTLDFETVSLIFKELYHMDILKLALVVKLAPDNIVMLTYFPYTPTSCNDLKPVIINHYLPDQKRWANLEYFPEKLQDFYGCPLTCCVWEELPYFGIKYDAKNGSVVDFVGIEAELLKFVGKNKNFSTKIRIMDNNEQKDVYNEGSLFAKLFSGTCDFALGHFAYKKELNHTSSFSQSRYFFLSHVYVVTNVLKVYSTYQKIAFPFHCIVWYILGFIFAISSLIIYTCESRRQWQRYRNFLIGSANRTPHFNLYAVAVGATLTITQMPKRNFPRYLLTCWILATLVLRSAYQSGMYQMLRDNMQWNPPHTIEQVFKQNYLLSMTPENRKYLPILPKVKHMRIFNTTITATFSELLNAKKHIAFITPYEYFGYFAITNVTQWRHLHLVSERLLTQQLTFHVRRHSYLIHELNDQISHAHNYGYIRRWVSKFVLPPPSGHQDADISNNSNIKALSMQELGAIFLILIWLKLLSVIVFLIELIWYKNCVRMIK